MKHVAGPHHVHTAGEIGVIMPISGAPQFDGKPKVGMSIRRVPVIGQP
jgi:hypothetical protein